MNKISFMKKLFVLLLCLFIALPLFGCQGSFSAQLSNNAFEIQLLVGQSGVSQNFAFPANAKYFSQQGGSEEDVNAYLDELVRQIRLQVWNVMFLNYFAIYSASPNNNYVIGGDYVTMTEADYNSATDCVEFSIIFRSYGAWNYYHPSSGDDEEESGDDNLFLDEDVSQADFIFSQSSGGQSLGQRYYSIVSAVMQQSFPDYTANAPQPEFRYDYATYHKRIHSNADVQYYDGLYHHVWQQAYQNLGEQKTVEIKSVNAQRGWWYVVALCSALAVAGIGAGVIYLVSKRKKAEKKKA